MEDQLSLAGFFVLRQKNDYFDGCADCFKSARNDGYLRDSDIL